MNKKIIAGGAAALLAVGLGVAAVGSTSAYFSDTNSGGYVAASLGSIKVSVDGHKTATPVLEIDGLLPGQTDGASFVAENTGRSTQDLHLNFSKGGLLWWNNQGKYLDFEVLVDGERVFYSDNLNWTVNPVPSDLQLAADVAPGQEVNVEIRVGMSTDWTTPWPMFMPLPYSVIATQPGIAPGA